MYLRQVNSVRRPLFLLNAVEVVLDVVYLVEIVICCIAHSIYLLSNPRHHRRVRMLIHAKCHRSYRLSENLPSKYRSFPARDTLGTSEESVPWGSRGLHSSNILIQLLDTAEEVPCGTFDKFILFSSWRPWGGTSKLRLINNFSFW